jgi:hypothetical protein
MAATILHEGRISRCINGSLNGGWFVLSVALLSLSGLAQATADEGPGDCLGVNFDRQKPVTIEKMSAANPRIYFVKSAWENAACPSDGPACQAKAYLVPGDLALAGKTKGAFTCISYQAMATREQKWTVGWIPTASFAPVPPDLAPARSDWTGTWSHAGGHVTISNGKGDSLRIEGEATYAAAQNVHTGDISATATPAHGLLAFADDGSTPFDKADDSSCLVRMQRLGNFLIVEDNSQCGGVMVTFTGFYQRQR